MLTECDALGGHGIVGVTLTHRRVPGGRPGVQGHRHRGPGAGGGAAASQPFSSDLSGQDFAKLIMAGWVPVGLALGISVGARHDDWLTVSQTSWGAGNAEVVGYTDLVNQPGTTPGSNWNGTSPARGEAVVVSSMDMRVRERECPMTEHRKDHIVEATIIGTATVRFAGPRHPAPASSLAIMSLDPQRRQAARVRLGTSRQQARRTRGRRRGRAMTDQQSTDFGVLGVPQDAMQAPGRAAARAARGHLHLGPVRERVPAGP